MPKHNVKWDNTGFNRGMVAFGRRYLLRAAIEANNEMVRDMKRPKHGKQVPGSKGSPNKRTGRGAYPDWVTRRSAPGEAPAVQRGRLAGSIAYAWRATLRIAVGTNVVYGRVLERWPKSKQRPWLFGNLLKAAKRILKIAGTL